MLNFNFLEYQDGCFAGKMTGIQANLRKLVHAKRNVQLEPMHFTAYALYLLSLPAKLKS